MQIQRVGFIFEIAGLPKDLEKVNLCKLFWLFTRNLFVTLAIITFVAICWAFWNMITWPMVGSAYLLAGKKPLYRPGHKAPLLFPALQRIDWEAYEWEIMDLPRIDTTPVRPIYPLGLLAIGWFLWWSVPHLARHSIELFLSLAELREQESGRGQTTGFGGVVASAIGISVFLAWRFFRSEVWTLCKEYLKAKKEKVCPIVEIV